MATQKTLPKRIMDELYYIDLLVEKIKTESEDNTHQTKKLPAYTYTYSNQPENLLSLFIDIPINDIIYKINIIQPKFPFIKPICLIIEPICFSIVLLHEEDKDIKTIKEYATECTMNNIDCFLDFHKITYHINLKWTSTLRISVIISEIIDLLKTLSITTKINQGIDRNILRLERSRNIEINNPAYLVIGARPGEPPKDRDFYNNTNYYMLNYEEGLDLETDRQHLQDGYDYGNHYFAIDFKDEIQLNALSILLKHKFDKICFDYSVIKFFIDKYTMLSRFNCIKKLLKDNGSLYIKDYYYLPIDQLKYIGFNTIIKPNIDADANVSDDNIIRDIFRPLQLNTGTFYSIPDANKSILILSATIKQESASASASTSTSGGSKLFSLLKNKRYSKTNYKKTRKSKCKSKRKATYTSQHRK